ARPGEAFRRRDHHVYVHLELEAGVGQRMRDALETYRRDRGHRPVVYFAARFEVRSDDNSRLPLSRSSKLYGLLRLVKGDRLPGEVPLEAVLGWRFRIQLETSRNSRFRDEAGHPIPKPEQLWHSVARHILEARAPAV